MVRKEPQASIIALGLEKFASGELERIASLAQYWQNKGLVLKTGKRAVKNA